MTCSKAASINQLPGCFGRPSCTVGTGRHGLLCGSCRQVGLVVLANVCGLWSTAIVLESGDEGATWTRSKDVPLKSLDEANLVDATPPESLVAGAPGSAWADRHGTAATQVRHGRGAAGRWPAPQTRGAPGTRARPCRARPTGSARRSAQSEMISRRWSRRPKRRLRADGGRHLHQRRCKAGRSVATTVAWLVRIVGDCPGFGYPGMIEAMPNGTLVIALGYPVGGVEVSLDGVAPGSSRSDRRRRLSTCRKVLEQSGCSASGR